MPADTLHTGLTALIWMVAGFIAVSGVDDVFNDAAAHLRRIRRRLTIYRRKPRASCRSLPGRDERACAVLLPAWREQAVISQMLHRLRECIAYTDYTVFFGHYPNDAGTAAAARS